MPPIGWFVQWRRPDDGRTAAILTHWPRECGENPSPTGQESRPAPRTRVFVRAPALGYNLGRGVGCSAGEPQAGDHLNVSGSRCQRARVVFEEPSFFLRHLPARLSRRPQRRRDGFLQDYRRDRSCAQRAPFWGGATHIRNEGVGNDLLCKLQLEVRLLPELPDQPTRRGNLHADVVST